MSKKDSPTPKKFLKEKEKSLIDVVGEEDWEERKVYTVEEVIQFIKEYHQIACKENKTLKS